MDRFTEGESQIGGCDSDREEERLLAEEDAAFDDHREQTTDETFPCKHCGSPSKIAPEDQSPPADYCHEADHG